MSSVIPNEVIKSESEKNIKWSSAAISFKANQFNTIKNNNSLLSWKRNENVIIKLCEIDQIQIGIDFNSWMQRRLIMSKNIYQTLANTKSEGEIVKLW